MNINLYRSRSKREFQQPDKISRHLRCSICHQVFQDPVRTACGHTFCYLCIENWANINKSCPLCKRSLTKRKLEKDLLALNIIDDLRSRCIHENCIWKGLYSQSRKHQRECILRPKKPEGQEKFQDTVQIVEVENNSEECQIMAEIVNVDESENNQETFP